MNINAENVPGGKSGKIGKIGTLKKGTHLYYFLASNQKRKTNVSKEGSAHCI